MRAAALLIICTLLLPLVAAQGQAPASATGMEMSGRIQGEIPITALALGNGIRSLSIVGVGGFEHYVDEGAYLDAAGERYVVPSPLPADPESVAPHELDLSLFATDGSAQFNIIAEDARLRFVGEQLAIEASRSPCLTQDDVQSADDLQGQCEGPRGGSPSWFTRHTLPAGLVFAAERQSEVQIVGNFTVELTGIDLEQDGDVREGRADDSDVAAGAYRHHFYRYDITDGIVQIGVTPDGALSWAATSSAMDVKRGHVRIDDGAGIVRTQSGLVDVADEDLIGDLDLRMEPSGDRIAFDTVAPIAPNAGDVATVASIGWAWGLGGLAALAPMFLIMVAVNRFRNDVSMAQVEQALDQGAFGRAERLSRRILRAEPRNESAHLSRSIALTKMGKQEAAVANLQAFLGSNAPTDGTLHYVMGLALLDMQRDDEARRAIDEAVRITPQLADQVDAYVRATEAGYS